MFGNRNRKDDDRDDRSRRDREDRERRERDDVQELSNQMGRDLHIGSDGFVRTSARDTISSNMADEKGASRGSSGGCGQSPDNVSDNDDD